jgi:Reverse transcriptase (RNA-dependent DNA polymerase)
MGLLGCPASFQRLMEGVLRNISNVIFYIDDLLVHTNTHEDHVKVLEQVLQRLHSNNLKINLDKCFFGNKEVSYLGFTLTPEGIKPGKNKLKAIKDAKPPTDVKTIRSFVSLCNFFRTHIKNFAIIAAHARIPDTRVDRYQRKQWQLFQHSRMHLRQNQSWHS